MCRPNCRASVVVIIAAPLAFRERCACRFRMCTCSVSYVCANPLILFILRGVLVPHAYWWTLGAASLARGAGMGSERKGNGEGRGEGGAISGRGMGGVGGLAACGIWSGSLFSPRRSVRVKGLSEWCRVGTTFAGEFVSHYYSWMVGFKTLGFMKCENRVYIMLAVRRCCVLDAMRGTRVCTVRS